MRNVCVIGGSRYFGRHLIELLRASGARVTVVNRGSSAPPDGVDHVIADRDDEDGFSAALAGRTFDVVLDQVCYRPQQAAIARRVFAGRTGRYVMTSTMEVYDPATSDLLRPSRPGVAVTERSVDPGVWPARPVHTADEAVDYAEGKRQAEAVFTRDPVFPYVSVRSAHVLGGGGRDFTGRLTHYVRRVAAGEPVVIHRDPFPTSFVNDREIAELLYWAAGAEFTGPVNACSDGELSVTELCSLVAARVGREPVYQVSGDGHASPYSFDRYYAMDNGRATRLGFTFSKAAEWLPDAITESLEA
ncbi:reductase [Streptosporangium sp. NBC_01639]|uniref:NAD-dependent epimerase/dehydratase family protein n=1 Tax=Streptosporangium sp. NBC_01639 TaxID=2975948 RepID=UPI003870693B|nr:reductase [Streptosporangium sp. NBC_01639]